jgi:hypothetical protein
MKALREEMIERPVDRFQSRAESLGDQRDHTEMRSEQLDRLEKSIHSLAGGLARLERKLDRVLALSVESRGRNRQ